MVEAGWRVCSMPAQLPRPASPAAYDRPPDWSDWLHANAIPAGTPFLLSPSMSYDCELNEFFRSAGMLASARNTQLGYARDLAAFMTFLFRSRRRRSWRDATEADHLAYLSWRRHDPDGPRVANATWDREVAAVNRFYSWQVRAGHVAGNPVPQRDRRLRPPGSAERGWSAGSTAATYSHGAARERVEWLPAASYRRWRDVGIRGHDADGLPDESFRGRWAARNAVFCDLMVRTGMRLAEQSALTRLELPTGRAGRGYQRFWLPPAIAKGGSARWIYVPAAVARELQDYITIDRAEVVEQARSEGRYRGMSHPLVVEDSERAQPVARTTGGRSVKLSQLDAQQRDRLLVDGPDGLEPAALWLSELGTPVAPSTWKSVFARANERCRANGVELRAHPHLLRHTFAVITLEQLQRGHINALAAATPEQRGHYTRVFGDPLDWVRRRLGHRSVTTTQIYLHALAELEMDTRMALVPDGWDDPRDDPPQDDTGRDDSRHGDTGRGRAS